jgi:hypothetical protein
MKGPMREVNQNAAFLAETSCAGPARMLFF